jgi:hypothetical protein
MHSDPPGGRDHAWLDGDAGPVYRPYAVTRGRVEPVAGGFDLVAFVVAKVEPTVTSTSLLPEHRAILRQVQTPTTVAEISSGLDLALGVVRVLLGDLLQADLISIYEPTTITRDSNEQILKAVINGLREL